MGEELEHLKVCAIVYPLNAQKGSNDKKSSLLIKVRPQIYDLTEDNISTVAEARLNSVKQDPNNIILESDDLQGGQNNIFGPFIYRICWYVPITEAADEKEKEKERIIARAYLQMLASRIDQMDDFEKVKAGKNFFECYYRVLEEEYALPSVESIGKISGLFYEKRENFGRLCFVKPDFDVEQEKGMVLFSEDEMFDFQEMENQHRIRKMLETTPPTHKEDTYRYIVMKKQYKNAYCCLGSIMEDNFKESGNAIVCFEGNGRWKIEVNGVTLLSSNGWNYYISEGRAGEDYLSKLPDNISNREFFSEIFDCLKKQTHGALLIIAEDAADETERLCATYKRGTKVEIKDETIEIREKIALMSGFFAVDGAVFVDYTGNIHAYGVILDGEAKTIGKKGRGARYNSAMNYIANTNKNNRYAVVVSEDKDKGIAILTPQDIETIEHKKNT